MCADFYIAFVLGFVCMMLVLSMNSKRQRRPNVRLGEIGDLSAAFACGAYKKSKVGVRNRRWKHDFVYSNEDEGNFFPEISQKSSEFTVSDPVVSPGLSLDLQQNIENKNPNSLKTVFELPNSNRITVDKTKLDFGNVRRKCRLMKRRGRNTKGTNFVFATKYNTKVSAEFSSEDVNNRVFVSNWNSGFSPEFSSEARKEYGEKEFVGLKSNTSEFCNVNGFNNSSDETTTPTSKDSYEDNSNEMTCQHGNSDELFTENGYCEVGNEFLKYDDGLGNVQMGASDVNSVRIWLEGMGFGKYAGLFETHEVDEEALPLLTFEDLKEMGVFAVGPRRKLFAAIRQLGEGG